MTINQFMFYQVKSGAKYREFRFCPYDELCKKNLRVEARNYQKVYYSVLLPNETAETLCMRLKKRLPKNFHGHAVSVSDVLVMNRDGNASAYYVDKEKLVDLSDFFISDNIPCDETAISLDTAGYTIEGKRGTWTACDETFVDGERFIMMQEDTFEDNALYIVLSTDGKIIVEDSPEFDEQTISQIRMFLNSLKKKQVAPTEEPHPPPKVLKTEREVTVGNENSQITIQTGRERKKQDDAEQPQGGKVPEKENEDEIEKRIAALPKPRVIDGRESAIDRLHVKQASQAIRSGKAIPKHLLRQMRERNRQ